MAQGIDQFRLTYEISPITLVGGLAQNIPGGMLPVISLTQANSFTGGLLQSNTPLGFDDFVAHFVPLPQSTIIDFQIGEYPFANQAVAANAVIAQPLRISLMMISPAPANGGYSQKTSAFTSLQQSLTQHIQNGGYFIVATPSFVYTTALLTGIRDVSSSDSVQVQTRWQWDFVQPLITQQQAASAQNALMSKFSNGTKTTGDPVPWSSAANATGNSQSGVGPPLIPAAQNLSGTNAAQSLQNAQNQAVVDQVALGNIGPGTFFGPIQ